MSTIKSNSTTGERRRPVADPAEEGRAIAADLAEYLTEYARQNPGYAALYCLGVGFVLGWKLKPW